MISIAKRHIKSGNEFNHLFPTPEGGDILVEKDATVQDTIGFIPQVVKDTLGDTKLIARVLKGKTLHDTCKNIWDFVYQHIPYKKDEDGKEQVRRPARVWLDRKKENPEDAGADCDCYSTFISSILTNLQIEHSLRICKYWYTGGRYTHIYPIVPTSDGKYITIDCVVNRFNYEEPFTEKQDKQMELHYLNGIDFTETEYDFGEMSGDGFGELGKGGKGKAKLKAVFNKAGKVLKKGLNVVNKVNPATVLLRNGLLASMKLNVFQVAEKLKYAYLTEDEAKKRGLNMDRWHKLKKVQEKIEKIFYGAGGEPKNLRNAILTGKGNPNKEVSGLADAFDESSPLSVILGEAMYNSEMHAEGMQGLGEPVTAAALASASATVAAIAAILKSIGDVKQKLLPGKKSDAGDSVTDTEIENLPVPVTDNTDITSKTPDSSSGGSNEKSADTSGGDSKEGFWDKNKKWIVPTGIGVGVLGLLVAAVKMSKKNEPKKQMQGLEGHQSHAHQQYYHKRKNKHKRKHYINAVQM